MDRGEKRFDVRVPIANTVLLQLLAEESEITGIVESRLIVQYATLYAQQRKGLLPLTAPGINVLAPLMQGVAQAEPVAPDGQRDALPNVIQPTLAGTDLDTLFGEPD